MSGKGVHAPVAAVLAVLAVVGALASCGGSKDDSAPSAAKASSATAELPPGRIAFRRFLDEDQTHGAIFSVATDGTDEKQLTDPAPGWSDDIPDWSPDGRLIAYRHCPSDPNHAHRPCSVWTVDANGGTGQKVAFHCRSGACDTSDPAWTPDGRLVATQRTGRVGEFGGEPQSEHQALEVLDLRSGQQQTILKRSGWTGAEMPQVSPDGRTIIYARTNSPRSKPPLGRALFAVGVDGSSDHQVAPWALGGGDYPSFSPDGKVLFRSFSHDESPKQSDYWTVRPDGSDLKQLTHFQIGTVITSASYSPDGNWIVYGSDYGHAKADLYVMRADGTGQRQLTHSKWWDSAPDWGPTQR